jgi:hypothetical protein
MAIPPNKEAAGELFSSVGAIASQFGDPKGAYVGFLETAQWDYPAEPWFLFNQPLSDYNLVRTEATATTSSGRPKPTATASNSARAQALLGSCGWLLVGAVTLVLSHTLLTQ